MKITYNLNEEDIKCAIADYCKTHFSKPDEKFELNHICLRSEINDRSQTQIFSATATPTKFNP